MCVCVCGGGGGGVRTRVCVWGEGATRMGGGVLNIAHLEMVWGGDGGGRDRGGVTDHCPLRGGGGGGVTRELGNIQTI